MSKSSPSACSDFLRGILVDSYGVPGDKVQRIFNAYHGPAAEDVKETRAEARTALDLDPDKRYLLTICRLMVWKRVDVIGRSKGRGTAGVMKRHNFAGQRASHGVD